MEILLFILALILGVAALDLIIHGETGLIGLLFAWRYRNLRPTTGKEGLIGASATVEEPFVQAKANGENEPIGYVRVHGELWKARLRPRAASPSVGSKVIVEAVDGLVVTVRT